MPESKGSWRKGIQMSYTSGDFRKIAGKKRTRSNLEEVQSVIGDFESVKDQISTLIEKAQEVRQAQDSLLDFLEETELEFDLKNIDGLADAIQAVQRRLPEEGSEIESISEYCGTVESGADNLESMLEDRDYGAEERDEQWYEITDNLGYIADGLDQLSDFGKEAEKKAEDDEEE